ncbi:hypothetical protein JZ751_024488 [Albula glossodonta]|uniref:BZIP domain-containing protein n=1 Tax=Albula glossodonta TaxID=121402 RepID=A0A8T2PEG5_9TELE|nr:hypothetical protein JZ751_024488 [Albula glossodonta]
MDQDRLGETIPPKSQGNWSSTVFPNQSQLMRVTTAKEDSIIDCIFCSIPKGESKEIRLWQSMEAPECFRFQGCDGIELLDLLFDQADGILRNEELGHHGNQPWSISEPAALSPAEDFLNVLLRGGDSVSGSPQWSPSPSDSGISEDPHSDHMDSPPPPDNLPMELYHFNTLPRTKSAMDAVDPNFSIDLGGWPSTFFPGRAMEKQLASEPHKTQMSSGFPLTVKDLLLSGSTENSHQPSQQSFQELILNEDEKKLLIKEGVTLPTQLPLTKYEERILKKIRRKIRNKQSAQESRKKKKEYIDGLESRMAAYSAQNQELQRKVFQLEKRNTSLMEQLRRLQALVMNESNKTAQTGTCILVLILSFSLILFPCLKPLSDSKVSQEGDFGLVRVNTAVAHFCWECLSTDSPHIKHMQAYGKAGPLCLPLPQRAARGWITAALWAKRLKVQSRSLHNVQSSRVLHSLDHMLHSVMEEQQEGGGMDKGVEEITSLLAGSSLIAHNASLEERDHRHGDPITGHITTVTWAAHHDMPLRSYADDM